MTLQDALVAALALLALVWLVRSRLSRKKACDSCALVAAAGTKKPAAGAGRPGGS